MSKWLTRAIVALIALEILLWTKGNRGLKRHNDMGKGGRGSSPPPGP